MPTDLITQVNPLDLQGNITIGISLPFNGPSGPFNKTYSTKDQIKSNLINLLLTNKGERLYNPDFGADLKTVLFEGIDEDTSIILKNLINTNVSIWVPEVTIINVGVIKNENNNTISVTIQYRINISGTPDQITVQFI
jgi:phage baseplate assembly protein W